MRVLGAVLAGGESRRFGSDKADAILAGKRMLDHAADALRAVTSDIIVVGRNDPGHVSIGDVPEAGLGPLGGLCAALLYAETSGYDAVLTLGCDVPCLPRHVADALMAAAPSVLSGQPVVGCWPSRLGIVLRDYINSGNRRSVMAWAETAKAVTVVGVLPNVNTPDDLGKLEV